MNNSGAYPVNWDRAISVDTEINKKLVSRLAPSIRAMRQESDDPITVLIDSPGGALQYLEKLFELLRAPDKAGHLGRIVAVATKDAASAAANLLAWGDYSIALDHSSILCHDVRLSRVRDLTPEMARQCAKRLQDTNDYYAQVLAERIFERMVRTYGALKPGFAEICREYPDLHRSNAKLISHYLQMEDKHEVFDLASFATSLWAHLSSENDGLIETVMDRLGHWMRVMPVVESTPTYKASGSRVPGMLDGSRRLHKLLGGDTGIFERAAGDLKLLLSLLVSEISFSNRDEAFPFLLECATREFSFMRSMNDQSHVERAFDLMVEHSDAFLNARFKKQFKRMSDRERSIAFGEHVLPYVRLFWLFSVQVCRELYDGEHKLSPTDAMLLGLVDEVWETT